MNEPGQEQSSANDTLVVPSVVFWAETRWANFPANSVAAAKLANRAKLVACRFAGVEDGFAVDMVRQSSYPEVSTQREVGLRRRKVLPILEIAEVNAGGKQYNIENLGGHIARLQIEVF